MPTASLALHHPPAYRALGRRARLLQDAAVVLAVLALHGAALWALQNGLTEPATPPALALPRVITAQLIPAAAPAPVPNPAPAAPQAIERPPPPEPVEPVARTEPPRPAALAKTHPEKKAPPRKPAPVMRKPPTPAPQAAPAPAVPPEPAPSAPVAPPPSAAAQAPEPAPAAAGPVTAASAPTPRTVLPSSSAAYLNNPPPPYPPLSRRLGESGVVVVRVLIGTNGRAEKAQIEKSSGYERLDHAALETARDRWRYVPGTRGGVPEAMWFNVPIKFVLE